MVTYFKKAMKVYRPGVHFFLSFFAPGTEHEVAASITVVAKGGLVVIREGRLAASSVTGAAAAFQATYFLQKSPRFMERTKGQKS